MRELPCNLVQRATETQVENYIVRIYRREADDPASVVGIIECVESSVQVPFHGLGKLGDLLACGKMLRHEAANVYARRSPAGTAIGIEVGLHLKELNKHKKES